MSPLMAAKAATHIAGDYEIDSENDHLVHDLLELGRRRHQLPPAPTPPTNHRHARVLRRSIFRRLSSPPKPPIGAPPVSLHRHRRARRLHRRRERRGNHRRGTAPATRSPTITRRTRPTTRLRPKTRLRRATATPPTRKPPSIDSSSTSSDEFNSVTRRIQQFRLKLLDPQTYEEDGDYLGNPVQHDEHRQPPIRPSTTPATPNTGDYSSFRNPRHDQRTLRHRPAMEPTAYEHWKTSYGRHRVVHRRATISPASTRRLAPTSTAPRPTKRTRMPRGSASFTENPVRVVQLHRRRRRHRRIRVSTVTDGVRTSSLDATTIDGKRHVHRDAKTVTGTSTRDNTGDYNDGQLRQR